jgi:transcriptional regulator with XRE-family HTH domain
MNSSTGNGHLLQRGDLGRRIARQRHGLGLTRDEAAELAGMSVSYLEYLETSPTPNPTLTALERLADALGTTLATLEGAGMDLPPGQRLAAPHPDVEILSVAECRARLGDAGIGRFLFVTGRGPVAIPVNYRMVGDDIVFRTGASTSVRAGARQRLVSFSVDHIDDTLSAGWSVLASGRATLIAAGPVWGELAALDIEPWAGGPRDTYIRLTTCYLTGRRIQAVPGPETEPQPAEKGTHGEREHSS